jgi:hypothetical protein
MGVCEQASRRWMAETMCVCSTDHKSKGEEKLMNNAVKSQKPRWYDRENWPYASDRTFVKEFACWIKKVDWQLFGTLTFAWQISDERADRVFAAFIDRLERVLRADVAYVCGSEKRFSGCGRPGCCRHFHLLMTSSAQLHPAFIKFLWQGMAGNRSDDAGAKIEPYDPSGNAAEYVLKHAPEADGEWKFRNLELFHPAGGFLDMTARFRRRLHRHKERQKKFSMISSSEST